MNNITITKSQERQYYLIAEYDPDSAGRYLQFIKNPDYATKQKNKTVLGLMWSKRVAR